MPIFLFTCNIKRKRSIRTYSTHSNREITSKLEVGPFLRSSVTILINPTLMYQIGSQFSFSRFGIHPEIFFKIVLYSLRPLGESPFRLDVILPYSFDAIVGVLTVRIQFVQPGNDRFGQGYNFYRGAVARCTRFTPITGFVRRTHLIHPRAAIPIVSAEYESCKRNKRK